MLAEYGVREPTEKVQSLMEGQDRRVRRCVRDAVQRELLDIPAQMVRVGVAAAIEEAIIAALRAWEQTR